MPHAWKNTGTETGRVLSLYTPAEASGFFEEQLGRPAGSANGPVSLSRFRTVAQNSATNNRQTAEPMEPAAPVTNTFII
jgi:hypothetical protein